jgi:hypothetical protein
MLVFSGAPDVAIYVFRANVFVCVCVGGGGDTPSYIDLIIRGD